MTRSYAVAFILSLASAPLWAQEPRPQAKTDAAAPAPAKRQTPSADDGAWGNLVGRFVYDGIPPSPAELEVLASSRKRPRVFDESLVVGEDGGLANVVLFVTSKAPAIHPEYLAEKPSPVKIEMRELKFAPHVVGAWTSQNLLFKNADVEGHNVNFAPLGDNGRNQILQPGGTVTHVFRRSQTSPVKVTSVLFPWMVGWIVVRDHPYFAVTAADGKFDIENLPVGELEFAVWHERSRWLQARPGWTDKGRFRTEIKPGTNALGSIAIRPEWLGVSDPVDPFRARADKGK